MRPLSYSHMTVRLALVSTAIWSGGNVLAAEMNASCPMRIPGSVVKPDKPVEGWTTTVAEQLHLTAAGILAGAPQTKTYLVPQKDTKTVQTYSFSEGDGERWLWCSYGGAGGVELARKLDEKATSCTIISKMKKPERTLSASVQCK